MVREIDMQELYALQRNEFTCPFLGFALDVRPGWAVAEAKALGSGIAFIFRRAAGRGYLNIHAYARGYRSMARYFEDDLARQRQFPARSAWPFGEAYTTQGSSSRGLLFIQNQLIFSIGYGLTDPVIRSEAETMLRSLRFHAPAAERVPPALKAFKYLHSAAPLVRPPQPALQPELVRAELAARVARHHRRIEQAREHWDRILPAKVPGVYNDFGAGWLGAGIGHLLLRQREEALACFREAAESFLRENAYDRDGATPASRVLGLEAPILSRDRALARRCAEGFPHPRSSIEVFNLFALALRALILEEDGAGAEAAKRLLDVPADAAIRAGSYPDLGKACQAIIARDAGALGEALEAILERHDAMAKRSLRNLEEGWLCLPATTLALLAKDRGVDVVIGPDRRSELKLKVVFSEPHKGEETAMLVDFVPLDLLEG